MKKQGILIGKIFNRLPPMAQILLIAAVYLVLQLLVPVLLFRYSSVLGFWWLVLLVLYTALLVFFTAVLMRRREIRKLEGQYGTEFVLRAFPDEKKRRERRAERTERRQEKAGIRKKGDDF